MTHTSSVQALSSFAIHCSASKCVCAALCLGVVGRFIGNRAITSKTISLTEEMGRRISTSFSLFSYLTSDNKSHTKVTDTIQKQPLGISWYSFIEYQYCFLIFCDSALCINLAKNEKYLKYAGQQVVCLDMSFASEICNTNVPTRSKHAFIPTIRCAWYSPYYKTCDLLARHGYCMQKCVELTSTQPNVTLNQNQRCGLCFGREHYVLPSIYNNIHTN